ncbi:MAG: hypothetical protein IKP65_03485 [Alphaproteobacteria bacterium]|nr:hypothetical protein [Alphaproteobacteria bacterium]
MKKSLLLLALLMGCSSLNYSFDKSGKIQYNDLVKSTENSKATVQKDDLYICNKQDRTYMKYCDENGYVFTGNIRKEDKEYRLVEGDVKEVITYDEKDRVLRSYTTKEPTAFGWGIYNVKSFYANGFLKSTKIGDDSYINFCENEDVAVAKIGTKYVFKKYTINGVKEVNDLYCAVNSPMAGCVFQGKKNITGKVTVLNCAGEVKYQFSLLNDKLHGDFNVGDFKTSTYDKGTLLFDTFHLKNPRTNSYVDIDGNEKEYKYNIRKDFMKNDKVINTIYSMDKDITAITCHERNGDEDKVTTYSMLSPNWNSIELNNYKCPETK